MTEPSLLTDPDANAHSALVLSPRGSDRTPVELLARRGYDRLLAVARQGRGEALLDAWWTSGQAADVGVAVVGGAMRSVAESRGTNADSVFLRGIEDDSPSAIHRAFTNFESAWSDGTNATALYVDGIPDMLSADGIGTTFDRTQCIVRRASRSGPTAFASLPASAPGPVVAGIAPLFDTVLELDQRDGEPTATPRLPPVGLPYDRVFDLLSPARRRRALRVLDRANEPLGIDGLAKAVASRVPAESSADRVNRLRTHFYQTDVPKLAEAGVVDFDRDGRRVSLRPEAVQLWPCLSTAAAADSRQP